MLSVIVHRSIHRDLGPELLESAYEVCLVFDLVQTGLKVEQQKPLPILYRGTTLECGIQRVINNFPDSMRTPRSLR